MAAVFKNFYGFRVGDALKGFFRDKTKPVQQALVDKAGKDVEVALVVVQGVIDKILGELLGEVHVSLQVTERHFRFNHPELGSVAAGVGVFCPEGGTEGVDVGECGGKGLTFELTTDSEVSGFAKEVIFKFLGPGLAGVQRSDAEHFSSTFTIGVGDDRGVHVGEITFVKKPVRGLSHTGAHAEEGSIKVGARAQVGDGAQELSGVAFFLQGVVGGGFANEFYLGSMDFPLLSLAG